MNYYRPNPACRCMRCRTRGLTGPAMLVTLGVLMLLNEVYNIRFQHTWPVILIVLGIIRVTQSNAPTDGHIERYPYPPVQPGQPPASPSTNSSPNPGQVQNG